MTTVANTTVPQTTAVPSTTVSSATGSSNCNIAIPDYKTLRDTNITKIKEYYNTLLTSYTKNYTDYATQSASSNVNDRTYAATTIKDKVSDFNNQIINLSQTMINTVNQDTDLITEQKKQLDNKSKKIDDIMSNIKLLTAKDEEMSILTNARLDSLNSTRSGSDDMQFTTYVYIAINVIMVVLIIGLIFYIMYYGVSKNNNNNINNNNNNNNNNSNSRNKNM